MKHFQDADEISTAITNARSWEELEYLKVPAIHFMGSAGTHAINARKKALFELGQAGPTTARYQSLDIERLSVAVTVAAQAAVVAMGSFEALTPEVLRRVARSLPVADLGALEPAHTGTRLPSSNGMYYALRNHLTRSLDSGEMRRDLQTAQELPEQLPAYMREWFSKGMDLTRQCVADPGCIGELQAHLMLALEHLCD